MPVPRTFACWLPGCLAFGLPGETAGGKASGNAGGTAGGKAGRRREGRRRAGRKAGGKAGGKAAEDGSRLPFSGRRKTQVLCLPSSCLTSSVFRNTSSVFSPPSSGNPEDVFRRPSCVRKAETGRLPSSGPKSGRRKTEARPESGTQTGSQRATLFYLCGPGPWQPEHRLRRGPASQTARQQATQAS